MRAPLLLDSHTLLWALHDPGRMRPAAVDAIRDGDRGVFFSAASVWELELKAVAGRLNIPPQWLEAVEATGFTELPVTASVARASARLPWHHRDPFDRLLVAQAREHGLTVATRDPLLSAYEVSILEV